MTRPPIKNRQFRRPHPPFRVMNDATVESLLQHLSESKRSVVLMNDDAAAAIANWSGSKGQQGRTLSIINRLYDGQSMINDARIGRDSSVVIDRARRRYLVDSAQYRSAFFTFRQFGKWLLRPGISRDGLQPTQWAGDGKPQQLQPGQLWAWVRSFTDIIADCRARQDAGQYTCNGVMPDTPRRIILLSPAARQLLADYNLQQERAADESLTQGYNHMQAFQVRSAENAARIAAGFAALRGYIETGIGQDNLPVNPPVVSPAENVGRHRPDALPRSRPNHNQRPQFPRGNRPSRPGLRGADHRKPLAAG